MICTEGHLQFDFSQALRCLKFDDPATHGLSHCMKAVDFVVETGSSVIFIEVKDPQQPHARQQDVDVFRNELFLGVLTSQSLVPKCRDSFLYHWCWTDKTIDLSKPIHYYVLIALDTLQPAELSVLTDALKRHLPLQGPSGRRWSPFIQECGIFNLQTWARHLGQHFPVVRIP